MKRLGIVNPETWDFLHDLHASLTTQYETTVFVPRRPSLSPVFRERLARHRLNEDLKSFLRRNDVVFFEWASELLARASQLPKTCAIVTRLHRYELYTWVDRINWNAVDQVILVSEAKRRDFARRFPAHAHKTSVIPAGVPIERFDFVDKPFSGSLGTLCHLTPRKRVYDLILALADLLRAEPSLHLYVGGDQHPAHMDYADALLHLVKRLDLESRVTFDGPVDRPADWYLKVDVFISHSYSEGLQVAPMEAMASGCSVVCHHWDGADELLPGDRLYVTNAELQQRLQLLCGMNEAARQLDRQRMRRIVEQRFDARIVNERVVEIVERAAGGSTRMVKPNHAAVLGRLGS
jgi:glycosyltransferase involved in cell wall biosynthesis